MSSPTLPPDTPPGPSGHEGVLGLPGGDLRQALARVDWSSVPAGVAAEVLQLLNWRCRKHEGPCYCLQPGMHARPTPPAR